MGSGRIVPRILDLDSSCKSVVSFTIRPLYPVTNYTVPQKRSGLRGKKEILALPGLELGPSVVKTAAIPTERMQQNVY
jgi:hypothetical protein